MRKFSLPYRTGFDWAFKSNVTHVLMHVFLYAVLAWLISLVFSNKQNPISPITVVLVALGISILQESIQLLSIKCPVGGDDIFDVLVDISGALIGVFVFRWRKNILTQSHREKK
jgi:VanZ family protein